MGGYPTITGRSACHPASDSVTQVRIGHVSGCVDLAEHGDIPAVQVVVGETGVVLVVGC